MKNKRITFYKVFLLFLTVYFSCNSFVLAVKFENYSTYLMIILTLVVGMVALMRGYYNISNNAVFFILICAFNIGLTIILNGYMAAYMLLLLNFILVVSYIRIYTKQEFYESYISVMKFLSIIAIIVGLINSFAPELLSVFPLVRGSVSSYRDLLFALQISNAVRINSIWGEPGMFSVFLVFALIFEGFYVNRKIKIVNYVIFVTAITLTFSTNGLICLTLILLALILNRNQNAKENRIVLVTIVLVVCMIYAINNVDWFKEQILASSSKLNQDDISFVGRLAPILYNIIEGIKSPVAGHGLKGGSFYVDFSFYTGTLFCNTSTTTFLFFTFGILFSGVTVYLMWKIVKNNMFINSKITEFLLFVIILINVNTQAVHLDQIYYIILFSVFMNEGIEYYSDGEEEMRGIII